MQFYVRHASLAVLAALAYMTSPFVEAFKPVSYCAPRSSVLPSYMKNQGLQMAMDPLSKPLVPHAAPTDTPASLKDMTDRALDGLSRKKVVFELPTRFLFLLISLHFFFSYAHTYICICIR